MPSSPSAAVRAVLDRQVAVGHVPGYAAAPRHHGGQEVLVGDVLTLGEDRPVQPDTPFRLSSVTTLFAAVLALSLVEDGTSARACRGDCTSASDPTTVGGAAGTADPGRRRGQTLAGTSSPSC